MLSASVKLNSEVVPTNMKMALAKFVTSLVSLTEQRSSISYLSEEFHCYPVRCTING